MNTILWVFLAIGSLTTLVWTFREFLKARDEEAEADRKFVEAIRILGRQPPKNF